MSREQYVAIARYMVQHSKIKGAFVWAQRALAGLVYACYPCFLLYSLLTKGVRVFWVLLVLRGAENLLERPIYRIAKRATEH